MLRREDLIAAVAGAVEDDPRALALWEAGSKAFGRADQYSDVDLQILVEDSEEAVDAVAGKAMLAVEKLGEIERRWLVPRPAWHGHWQAFVKLTGTDPYLLLDLCVMRRGAAQLFDEREAHGVPSVLFDKTGALGSKTLDWDAHWAVLRARVPQLEDPAELFHNFVDKELARGRPVDAFAFYLAQVLRPLVEALRILHCPERYNFGLRYLDFDLPPEAAARVRRLVYAANESELLAKKAEAVEWLRQTLGAVKKLPAFSHK